METKYEGLTKEEKVMFSILGIILVIAIGILIINGFSENERTLKTEMPINETEKDRTEDDKKLSDSDINLIEDNTDKVNNKITYVANLTSSKKGTSSVTNISNEEIKDTTSTENLSVQWDFSKNIVVEADEGTTIKIEKNVILKDGSEVEAQVTLRKLVDDTYMIQDISEGSILLTEGTYKYYYTYANITKELVLVVRGHLNPIDASLPSIIDTEGLDEEYFNDYNDLVKTSNISVTNNSINMNLKSDNKVTEIPIYLTLDSDLTDISVTSKTFGVNVLKNTSTRYSELASNQIVMLINLEIISTTELDEVEVMINGITYVIKVNIKKSIDDENDSEDNSKPNEKEEDKNTSSEIEDDVKLPDKTNPDENNETIEGNENIPDSSENLSTDILQMMRENIFDELS